MELEPQLQGILSDAMPRFNGHPSKEKSGLFEEKSSACCFRFLIIDESFIPLQRYFYFVIVRLN